jgi:hypothetical protein
VAPTRITLPDGRRVNAGTAEDAGQLCARGPSRHDRNANVTERRRGVTAATYRHLAAVRGAPKALQVPDGQGGVRHLTNESGAHLYDLDAVRAWDRARPGPGNWRSLELRRTALRVAVLAAARDGYLSRPAGEWGVRVADAAPAVLRDPARRVRTVVTDLEHRELLSVAADGRVSLSRRGAEVLEQWSGEPRSSP